MLQFEVNFYEQFLVYTLAILFAILSCLIDSNKLWAIIRILNGNQLIFGMLMIGLVVSVAIWLEEKRKEDLKRQIQYLIENDHQRN